MHRKLLSLVLMAVCAVALQAQVIIDQTSLIPDDTDEDVTVEAVADTVADAAVSVPQVLVVPDPEEPAVAVPQAPEYMLHSVYRSWRRSHPVRFMPRRKRSYQQGVMAAVDSLSAVVAGVPYNPNHEDMLYLYDMRLPIISSGNVPVDSISPYYEHTQFLEDNDDQDVLHVAQYDRSYVRQRIYENHRHLVRYRYASADPRRFRYVRRNFDVPTNEGQTLDTKTSVQQTRVADDLDVDLSKADLDWFGQYFEISADRWHWQGDHTLTMQQTSQSSNWYKGGDNNMSVSGNQKITVKRYDEDAKTTFEAVFDLKLSGYYTKADTIHSMKVSDNELSLTFKYGYKAWKKWYYSAQLYSKTPVFDYYKPNSTVCSSTFFSPLETNLSLGVDYQYTSPNKRFAYSLLLAPLSYDLKYVRDPRVAPTLYGIAEGDKSLHKIGSSITTKFEWKMSENASWSSRLYYFTPYHSLQVEFENTFNFRISRYFTARIYAYPRFDDSRDVKAEIKEMLTFGFSYQW